MTRSRWVASLVVGLGLLTGLGCGTKGSPPSSQPVQPARGKVTLGGQPMSGGALNLSLVSNNDKYGTVEAVAEIQPDGTFEAKQYGDKPGLVPGKWKVVVRPNYVKDGKTIKLNVPAKYTKEETSDLSFEIPEGGKTDIVINLQ
ncbi:MAG TPA: hypothetical protein VKE74_06165 [Gemmataceae bacterium]|nr:hypothetical protein [Gemmataceae bacterium]